MTPLHVLVGAFLLAITGVASSQTCPPQQNRLKDGEPCIPTLLFNYLYCLKNSNSGEVEVVERGGNSQSKQLEINVAGKGSGVIVQGEGGGGFKQGTASTVTQELQRKLDPTLASKCESIASAILKQEVGTASGAKPASSQRGGTPPGTSKGRLDNKASRTTGRDNGAPDQATPETIAAAPVRQSSQQETYANATAEPQVGSAERLSACPQGAETVTIKPHARMSLAISADADVCYLRDRLSVRYQNVKVTNLGNMPAHVKGAFALLTPYKDGEYLSANSVAAMTGPLRFGRVIEIAPGETTQLPDILMEFAPNAGQKSNLLPPFATVIDLNIESPDGNGAFWEADGGVLTKLWSGTVSF
jgi:hypothetical protein